MVQALTRLIRLRSTHPAFDGEFTLHDGPPRELVMVWCADDAQAELYASLADSSYRLACIANGTTQTGIDMATLASDATSPS